MHFFGSRWPDGLLNPASRALFPINQNGDDGLPEECEPARNRNVGGFVVKKSIRKIYYYVGQEVIKIINLWSTAMRTANSCIIDVRSIKADYKRLGLL